MNDIPEYQAPEGVVEYAPHDGRDPYSIVAHVDLRGEAAEDPTTRRRLNESAIAQIIHELQELDPNLMDGLVLGIAIRATKNGKKGHGVTGAFVGPDKITGALLIDLAGKLADAQNDTPNVLPDDLAV